MCSVQPSYLDTCLSPFLKMLQRLVRDHVTSVAPYGGSSTMHMDQNQKFTAELLCISLEMLCPRIHFIPLDAKKSFAQYILVPLIEKNAADKVVEMVNKVC